MFKAGDTIQCVLTNAQYRVFCGLRYTVREVHGEWMNLTHTDLPYHVSYFKKVDDMTIKLNEKAKAKTKTSPKPVVEAYYVRHKPSGHGVSLSANYNSKVQIPATLIATYSDAVNEANRLAELHAGSEFVILGVVYKVKKVPVYTTEAQEYTV